jgi:threonine dehydratase
MITLADIRDVADRLEDIVVDTPLLTSLELDDRVGGRVVLKPECLQRTGSFKIRGAYNLMSQLTRQQAARGVVAWSSGNHAQGVAAAGKLLDIKTTIVMPEDAPRRKIENTRHLGGKVVLFDRYNGDREAIAREIAAETGAELVPSYEHDDIIAGQGTVGMEIMDQSAAMGLALDQVLICCGGGGLSSGSAIAIKEISPATEVFLVEPEDFDDTLRSFQSGERMANEASARSICDALQTEMPGELTFDINRRLASGVLTVTDAEVATAMRFAFRHLKLVVEPGGAVALAAVLAGKIDAKGKTTAIVLSGGNVDEELFASIQEDG